MWVMSGRLPQTSHAARQCRSLALAGKGAHRIQTVSSWMPVNGTPSTCRTTALTTLRSLHTRCSASSPSATPAPSQQRPYPANAGRPRVCILGGGFGGLCAAVRLDGLQWAPGRKPEITLVDQNDRFVFKPLMYELLAGRAPDTEVAPPFLELLSSHGVRFKQDRIESVKAESSDAGGPGLGSSAGTVTLKGGEQLSYDYLVVAMGGVINMELAEGAREHALKFSDFEDVQRLKGALAALEATVAATGPAGSMRVGKPVVTLVGAGYAGIELAACVADRLGDKATVQIVSDGGELLPGMSEALADTCRRTLESMGVQMRAGRVTKVAPSEASTTSGAAAANPYLGKIITLETEGGLSSEEASDLVLWTAGQKPTSRVQQSGLPFELNGDGGILTNSALQVPADERVFAVGDTAAAEARTSGAGGADTGGPWPATAQVALQQADYVAWNVWAAINGRPLLPFKYQHLGDLMSLGRGGVYAAPVAFPDSIANAVRGSPLVSAGRMVGVNLGKLESGITLEGWLGGAFRRVAYWYRQPTNSQKARVGRAWLDAFAREGPSAALK